MTYDAHIRAYRRHRAGSAHWARVDAAAQAVTPQWVAASDGPDVEQPAHTVPQAPARPTVAPKAVWTPPRVAKRKDGSTVIIKPGSWDDYDAMRRETVRLAGGFAPSATPTPDTTPRDNAGPKTRAGSTLRAAGGSARGAVHVAKELRRTRLTRAQKRAAAKRRRAEQHRMSARLADGQERVW